VLYNKVYSNIYYLKEALFDCFLNNVMIQMNQITKDELMGFYTLMLGKYREPMS